jgi:DNA-binding response OmpR family regulator
MPDTRHILWADDEIDLLRPHVLFLEDKGFKVEAVANGEDAVSAFQRRRFDAVLLDEMMPGMGGLKTLEAIKELDPTIPVVLITKSEEEWLMDEAIGKRISDYLIKPVNPSQIFLAIKRLLEGKKLEENRLTRDFVEEFSRIRTIDTANLDVAGWIELYGQLTRWELELTRMPDVGLAQSHEDLVRQANVDFGRYVEENYARWVGGAADRPPLSPDVVRRWVQPHLSAGRRVFLVVIDCMRADQWLTIEPMLEPYFEIAREHYFGILPTATPYARNAIFAGLYPSEIHAQLPDLWQERVPQEKSKNRYERELLEAQVKRLGNRTLALKYVKIYSTDEGASLVRQVASFADLDLVALVFNFIDILAHGRSESDILRELAPDQAGFRSLMGSWFAHSALFEVLKGIAGQENCVVVITTDHGSVMGRRAALVYGDRTTSTNLRYKFGKNLGCDTKQALHIKNPAAYKLPADTLNKHYIVAKEDYYFVYPTNFHEYERQYRGSFQHGGISMEEMIVPAVTLTPRR